MATAAGIDLNSMLHKSHATILQRDVCLHQYKLTPRTLTAAHLAVFLLQGPLEGMLQDTEGQKSS